MPGATGGEITAALETSSGKKCGVEFGLCYSPEFIALGSVVRNLLKPDFVLIGESDSRAGDVLSDVYRSVCDNNPPIARMNFVNAELAKISVNTFVTTKISYANMLAEICEHLPGANVDIVTSAIGLDQRIGSKYLKGATGYGGPCFPRDNVAFSRLAEMIGASAEIAQATDLINRRQAERLASLIGEHLSDGATVGILGLAYKPDTPVIEESQGVALARFLLERGSAVVVYDPLAMEGARTILGDRPVYANSARECAQQVDALVLMIPCEEFKAIEPADLNRNHGYRVVVLDSWRILNREQFEPVCHYINLGVGLEHNVPVTQSTR
jgi:UDPglucose 6-dehydrogenase